MTTLVLQFDRELKTAASQICSSMKSGKRNRLSTLLVIFQYLLYLLTVKGFSFFRSTHLTTPLLILFFIRGWRDSLCLHVNICSFLFWPHAPSLNRSRGTRCKLSALRLFWQVASVIDTLHHSLGRSFPPRRSRADRTAGQRLIVSWSIFCTSSVSSDTLGRLVQRSFLGL